MALVKTLGVNGTNDRAYLAVARDGEVIDTQPYSVSLATGMPDGEQLITLRDEIVRLLEVHRIDRVRILDAESNYQSSYSALTGRLTIETVIALAASEKEIDCLRLTRRRVRSILEIEIKGKLSVEAARSYPIVGGSWTGKRDLAALAAIAGNRG